MNTQKTYASGIKKYLKFCRFFALDPCHAEEDNILRFIAFLASENLLVRTVKVYLAAVRSWFIMSGLPVPCLFTVRVKLALRALEREHPLPSQVYPISITMLCQISKFLAKSSDNLMLFAVMCLAYFACLRSSEYCFEPALAPPLARSCFKFIESQPPLMLVVIPASKTLYHGFTAVVGCTGLPVCPVCTVRAYIQLTPDLTPPLFKYQSGQPLTYRRFSASLKSIVRRLGYNPAHFSPHSLRAGAATDAAQRGLPEVVIKQLGRWRSDAFQQYVRPSALQVAAISRVLADPLYP
jgi:site-specific recombinase XerD